MKTQIIVISPLGTIVGDSNETTPKQLEKLRELLNGVNDLSYMTFRCGTENVYIPGEILKHSIVKLDVQP